MSNDQNREQENETGARSSRKLETGRSGGREASGHSPEGAAMGAAEELANLLDGYLADLEAGQHPDRAKLIAEHPELGSQLEEALAGLEFIHGARAGAAAPAARLGDFQLIREIGRGGMGVVYEAEQVSLKRRVALKVLSAGAALDEVAMQRFQREAETVATLHHTNIVPIFAIGCERGVRYYAMQFIDGRNLAEVAGVNRPGGPARDFRQMAQWGLQAAEAIAHAHERGVIHRDIKPSNLILDREGRIWLTDFGLARRLEDVTLSLTGALLGTPRYMSPEQAAAATKPIDHRTDIYSLGATLYELVTGRPIFEATTPQAVINQILTCEPVPPRRAAPDLPRDLETIIIKCLIKEPTQRYATARELAEDLRAFFEQRAIRARRAGMPVRALRWARKHRRSTTVAGVSAAASLALLVAAVAGGRIYWQKHQGQLSLETREPLLQAEILPVGGQQAVRPPFSVPTRQTVPVAPGEYGVRLSAPGVLSETHLLDLEPGQQAAFDVTLQDRELAPAFKIEGGKVELMRLDGPADFIALRGTEMQRIDAATGKLVWRANLSAYEVTNVFRSDGERMAWVMGFDRLLRAAPDLDGDKTGDLVWTSDEATVAIAFSGQTGKLLWFHPGEVPEPAADTSRSATVYHGLTTGPPAVGEIDGDGLPDLLVLMTARSVRWVEAISGKTGKKLWTRWLEPRWLKTPAYTNQEFLPTPRFVMAGGQQLICLAAGTYLLLLDPRDGSVLHEHDFHAVVLQELQQADLDGDDGTDVVVFSERNAQQRVLAAYSVAARRPLWEQITTVPFEPYLSPSEQVGWPVVADLDHNGKSEVIMPAGSYYYGSTGVLRTDHWGGVQVLNGADGKTLWQRALARGRTQSVLAPVQHFTVGRDLDGDGQNDLFVASLFHKSFAPGDTLLFVDALSGKDGHSVWTWNLPQPDLHDRVSPVISWAVAGNAPLLAVWSARSPAKSGTAYLLDSGTGDMLHLIGGAFHLEAADCDGDDVPDLAFRSVSSPEQSPHLAQQHVIRGTVPREWSRLAEAHRLRSPLPDLDGDGTEEVLLADPLEALSGQTGSRLWRSGAPANKPVLLGSSGGDIDGDGVPDLLTFQEQTTFGNGLGPLVSAVSSRTGKQLWASSARARGIGVVLLAELVPAPKQAAAVVVALEMDVTVQTDPMFVPQRSNQVWLLCFNASNGVERWRKPLSAAYVDRVQIEGMPGAIADLDGDGHSDVVIGALNSTNAWEIRAHSGRDGNPIWSHALETQFDNFFNLFRNVPAPVLANLDSNGPPEVLFIQSMRLAQPGPTGLAIACRLQALDGATGQPRWAHSWRDGWEHYPVTPLPLRQGEGGKMGICVVERSRDVQLVLLDGAGTEVDRLKVNFRNWPAQISAADLDANGTDEILLVDSEGQARAISGKNLQNTVWQAPAERLVKLMPAEGVRPALVILERYQKLHGVSGATGQLLWTIPASGQRFGVPLWIRDVRNSRLLAVAPGPWRADAPTTGAVVCYGPEHGTMLSSTGAPGRVKAAGGPDRTPESVQAEDPRLARALPWNLLHPGFTPQHAGPLHEFRTKEAVLGLGLVLGLMLSRVVWRRWSWKVGIAVLLGVLVLIGLGAESARPRHLPPSWFLIILIRGILMVPFAAVVGWSIHAVSRRKWRLAAGIAGLAGLLSLAAGIAWLLLDQRDFVPGEHYSWQGWYFVFFAGAYLAGMAGAAAILFHRARSRFGTRGKVVNRADPTEVMHA